MFLAVLVYLEQCGKTIYDIIIYLSYIYCRWETIKDQKSQGDENPVKLEHLIFSSPTYLK